MNLLQSLFWMIFFEAITIIGLLVHGTIIFEINCQAPNKKLLAIIPLKLWYPTTAPGSTSSLGAF